MYPTSLDLTTVAVLEAGDGECDDVDEGNDEECEGAVGVRHRPRQQGGDDDADYNQLIMPLFHI